MKTAPDGYAPVTAMAGIMQNPAALLLITGSLIGLNFPLGKIAGDAGVPPMLWALLISLGACLVLLPVLLLQGRLFVPRGPVVIYVVVSGLVSFVLPNFLLFNVIPQVGAGYTGLMFALSPVFTLLLATLFGLKAPNGLGLIGITAGLVGAVIVSLTRGTAPEAPPLQWLAGALAIPLVLACGNVYRSLHWPDGSAPDVLAFWSHALATAVFLGLLVGLQGWTPLTDLRPAPLAALAQLLIAGLTYPAFFRLQQQGGPVLLSQIGYVAAGVGLLAATLLLGERYAPATWAGAAIIGLGVGITVIAQRRG